MADCFNKLFKWLRTSFANSRLSASTFKSFSRSLEQFFLTVGQNNNFGNKIPKCIYQKNGGDKSPRPCMFRSAWDHCGANSYRNFSVSWYVAPTDLLSRLMSASKHKGAFCFNTVHWTNIFDLKTMVISCLHFFILKFSQPLQPLQIPANLPGQFSHSGQICLH